MDERREDATAGTPLVELQGLTGQALTARLLSRFRALRILSAEELLAMSSTVEHRSRLATYLGMSLPELETLLAAVRHELRTADAAREVQAVGEDPQAGGPTEEDDMGRTRLRSLEPQPLSAEQLSRLRELHVTTAEELIAMSARTKSRQLLRSHLGISAKQLTSLLSKVKRQLDPQVVRDMLKAERGGPRGVLDPIPASKRRGRRRG
jgi:hypothetical protein